MTINSQASYWWIAVNINKPSNQEEEEGEEGRGGEGEATMGYIAGDNNNNIRTRQRLQLVRRNFCSLQFTIHFVLRIISLTILNKDISIEALARFSGISDSVIVSR